MKTLGIKKLLTAAAVLTAFALTACNDITKLEEETETAYLKINSSVSRTIAPNYTLDDITQFSISGYMTESALLEKELGNYKTYAELLEASIPIEQGTWHSITLYAYTKPVSSSTRTYFSATLNNVTITNGTNTLTFDFSMDNISSTAKYGYISVNFIIPSATAVKRVKAGLYDRSNDTAVKSYSSQETSQTLTPEETGGRSSALYEERFSAGTYRLKADFYADEDFKTKVSTYSELVTVIAGCTSSAERTIELNDIFTITEVLGEGGGYAEGYTPATIYTRYNNLITLPSVDNMEKEGYFFDGWFTSDDCTGEQITEIAPKEGKDITVYAKWIQGCVVYASKISSTDLAKKSYGDTYMIRLLGNWKTTDLHTFGLKIKAISDEKHITLDMTQTTGLNQLYTNTDPKVDDVPFYECAALATVLLPRTLETINRSAFYGCSSLESVMIPDSVTKIDYGAFASCSALKSIVIPNGVTSIGESAFYGCSALKSIAIPNGVISIGKSAFSGCSSLESVAIPDGIISIESYTFYNCKLLKDLTIPDTVTTIGDSAFYDCSSLTSVKIPDGVTSIGESAFSGCSSLESVAIPDGITSIERHTFNACKSLIDLTIPGTVTTIDYSAFEGCLSLRKVYAGSLMSWLGISFNTYTSNPCNNGAELYLDGKPAASISIPGSITEIKNYAFYNCLSLESVTIPDTVTIIGGSAFYNCSSLESVTIPDTVTTIGKSAFESCTNCIVTIGANLVSKSASVSSYFKGCKGAVIKDGVESIGNSAFSGCASFISVTIPATVTSIGEAAFSGCALLERVTIPNGVTSIGTATFSGCSALKNIEIPDGVTRIGWSAFSGCSSLTDVSIPNGVVTIAREMFYGCSSLKNIVIPESVTEIGYEAFLGCSSLESIDIPEGVTTIDTEAFYSCTALKSVTIPDSVTKIYSGVFSGCTNCTVTIGANLVSSTSYNSSSSLATYFGSCKAIIIKDGVTEIGEYAFYNFYPPVNITIPKSVTTVRKNAFDSYCTVITSTGYYSLKDSGCTTAIIKDGVTTIEAAIFTNCTSLKNVTIPDSVKEIGSRSFSGCTSLEAVTIPRHVNTIWNEAFSNCSKLKSITIPENVTRIGASAFLGCLNLTEITFLDTANWYATDSNNFTDGEAIDVTTPATNAANLRNSYSEWTFNYNYLYKTTE